MTRAAPRNPPNRPAVGHQPHLPFMVPSKGRSLTWIKSACWTKGSASGPREERVSAYARCDRKRRNAARLDRCLDYANAVAVRQPDHCGWCIGVGRVTCVRVSAAASDKGERRQRNPLEAPLITSRCPVCRSISIASANKIHARQCIVPSRLLTLRSSTAPDYRDALAALQHVAHCGRVPSCHARAVRIPRAFNAVAMERRSRATGWPVSRITGSTLSFYRTTGPLGGCSRTLRGHRHGQADRYRCTELGGGHALSAAIRRTLPSTRTEAPWRCGGPHAVRGEPAASATGRLVEPTALAR